MVTVYKYKFPITDTFTLALPISHRVILVDLQDDVPSMWVCQDTDTEPVEVVFHLEGTGHPVSPNTFHVGSFQQPPFVWHLFEEYHW